MEAGALARRQAVRVATPVLMLQDEEDSYVKPEAEDSFCKNAGDCTKVYFFGSRHEILIETDAIRNLVLDNIRSFLRKYMK